MGTKERVRVAAGRQGAPVERQNLPAPASRPAPPPNLQPAPNSLLEVIARAAADPNVNVDKMQALLNMQQQIEDRDARKAFMVAFAKLQKKLPSIQRDGRIEIREKDDRGQRTGRMQQSTPYATFNAIMKAIKKLLDENGFNLSFSTSPSPDGRIIVRGILAHDEGHERTTEFPLPAETSGSKNNVQGWGSAMSYGKRYCTIALLNIVSHAPEDADTDGTEGDFKPARGGAMVEAEAMAMISPAQLTELRMVMKDCGVTDKQVTDQYSISRLEELPSDMVEAVKQRCRNHKNRARNG